MISKTLLCACFTLFACGGGGAHSPDLESNNDDLAQEQRDLSGNVDAATEPDLVTAPDDSAMPPDATMLPLPAGWNYFDDSGRSANVEAVVIHPLDHELMFVATFAGGVFKSTDGGAHFARSNVGLLTKNCTTVAVDPKNVNNVFVGTANDGVFRSTDGGATWTQAHTGLSAINVQSLVVDNSGNVWAGLLNGDGVDELVSGTTTWVNKGVGLPSVNVPQLVLDSSGVLWAATTGGVAKYVANTSSWTAFNTGLPAKNSAYNIAVNPANPNVAYVNLLSAGFYTTTNGGTSWTVGGSGLLDASRALAIDPLTPATIYAGQIADVWVSHDSGATFTTTGMGINAGGNGIKAIAIDPMSTSTLFAGTAGFGSGIYKTTNGGTAWLPNAAGLTNLPATSVAVDPKSESNIYVATVGGVLGSTNGGESFTNLLSVNTQVIVVDPFDSKKLYAATEYSVSSSIDSGKTWTIAATSPGQQMSALVADPVNSGVLYAGAYGGVWRTADNAATWTLVITGMPATPYVLGVTLDPTHPTTLYATVFQGGTYRSTNSGSSWALVDADMQQSVAAIVAEGVVLIGLGNNNSGTLLRRATDGVTFASVTVATSLSDVVSFAVDASGVFYAGTYGRGVYRSTDKGLTWNVANRGLDSFAVSGLTDATIDGKDTLFAADSDGVYITQSGGI